jgi:hypothetical protein
VYVLIFIHQKAMALDPALWVSILQNMEQEAAFAMTRVVASHFPDPDAHSRSTQFGIDFIKDSVKADPVSVLESIQKCRDDGAPHYFATVEIDALVMGALCEELVQKTGL